jgi:ABC-type transport system involved in multi-copper enzyme maturation permease subunit
MRKQFITGAFGGFWGIITALYVISSVSWGSVLMISGVQAALFSSLGLMGAVIANIQIRFAGWMLLFSAIWITLSVPVAGTLYLFLWFTPAIILLAAAAVLCFLEPKENDAAVN